MGISRLGVYCMRADLPLDIILARLLRVAATAVRRANRPLILFVVSILLVEVQVKTSSYKGVQILNDVSTSKFHHVLLGARIDA